MITYEYDIVVWNDDVGWGGVLGHAGLKALLNEKGEDGWRLVAGDRRSPDPADTTTWIMLEREVQR